MPHRTGADKLIADPGTVGTVRLVAAADHSSVMLSADCNAAQLVTFLCQTGVLLGTLAGFLQAFDRYYKSSIAMHDRSLTTSPELTRIITQIE